MSLYPRCNGCGKTSGIMVGSVSRVRIVRGEGYELNTTMLCETCQDSLCMEMDVLTGITKRIPKEQPQNGSGK